MSVAQDTAGAQATDGDGGSVQERRWRKLWQVMEAAEVGALVVYGRGSLGAYGLLHSLTGHFPAPKGGFSLVEVGRPPVLLAGSEVELGLIGESSRAAGVDVRLGGPGPLAAAAGIALAEAAGGRRLALAAPVGGIPAGDLDLLRRQAGGADLLDLSAEAERIRAELEPEDEAALAAAAAGADAAIEQFAASFAVGMSEREAVAAIDAELGRRGALTRLVFVSGGRFRGRPPGDRALRAGEPITVLVEFTSPTGHWIEIGTVGVAGELDPAARQALDACVETLRMAERGLRPGARCGALAGAMLDSLRERGGRQISGLGHGTGVDEGGPVLVPEADAEVRAGTAFSVHPSYAPLAGGEGPSVTVANTFLVEAEAARPLSSFPYRTLELG
ncbi:MAG TPA: M24 family metallopeptidase [Solirubrobacterales bacterium]|nr:M24 family metallopeptidase [Solirubrobacterales bacterium]